MKSFTFAASLLLVLYQQVAQVDVQRHQVTAVVRDGSGRSVHGLKGEDFILEEDGVRQDIAQFQESSVTSISLGIFIDTCWEHDIASAEAWISRPPEAETNAVAALIGPQDEAILMGCSDGPGHNKLKIYEEFTSERRKIERHGKRDAGGGILDGNVGCCRAGLSRYEVIASALEKMKTARNPKRAMVVITYHADSSMEEQLNLASQVARISQYEIPIYVLGREEPGRPLDSTVPIGQLATETGGTVFWYYFGSSAAAPTSLLLEAEIRKYYLIGYDSKTSRSFLGPAIRARTKSPDQRVIVRRVLN
jgi:VWFA-related protein